MAKLLHPGCLTNTFHRMWCLYNVDKLRYVHTKWLPVVPRQCNQPRNGSSTSEEIQNAKIGAWFLGSKAENEDYYIEFMKMALTKHSAWRRSCFPEDPRSITAENQESPVFKEQMNLIDHELKQLIRRLRNSVPFFSSRYKGHMLWDTSMIGSLAYAVTSLWNPNNVATEASNVTTFIEIEVGKQLCQMLGYAVENTPDMISRDVDGVISWGHITSGGSIANIESLWAARSLRYLPLALKEALSTVNKESDLEVTTANGTKKRLVELNEWDLLNVPADNILSSYLDHVGRLTPGLIEEFSVSTKGMGSVKQGCYIVPASRHYSWDKAGALLGIGKEFMRIVEVDRLGRMKLEKLEEMLRNCLKEGMPVLSVVAVVGTTADGAIDPVDGILRLREDFRKQGLDFYIHADGAWGGYLCSMLPSETRPVSVPFLPLNKTIQTRLKSLKNCDSVTLDPHKSGYIQYPSGALCYRNRSVRYLLNYTAPYMHSESRDPSVGLYGIEGSKPGASVVATYLHNKVVGLNQNGHGLLLGQANFTAKMIYCVMITLADAGDPFRVACFQDLPNHVNEAQLKEILELSNKEIYENSKYIEILKTIGPDALINGLTVNFKWPLIGVGEWNTSNEITDEVISKMSSDLNISSDEPTTDVTTPQGVSRKKLFLIRNTLMAPEHADMAEDMRARVGLPSDRDRPMNVMVSTNMDPWPTTNGFMQVFRHELRQSIFRSVGAVMEKPDVHGFVAADAGNYRDDDTGEDFYEVFGDLLPVFSKPEHQYHLIVKAAFESLEEKAKFLGMAIEPRQPMIFANNEQVRLKQLLYEPRRITMNIFVGYPSSTNPPRGQVQMRITDIVRFEHFEPQPIYHKEAKYFLYGNAQSGAYLSHSPVRHPDYHNIVRVKCLPLLSTLSKYHARMEQSEYRLEYGTVITLPDVPGGPVSSPLLKSNSAYKFNFAGDYGETQTAELMVDDNVWFDSVGINSIREH